MRQVAYYAFCGLSVLYHLYIFFIFHSNLIFLLCCLDIELLGIVKFHLYQVEKC